MGILHAKTHTLRGLVFDETRAKTDLVKSKLTFCQSFPTKAEIVPISSPINRWQGHQWRHLWDLQQLVPYEPSQQPLNHLNYFSGMTNEREMTSPLGFSTLTPIPGPNELPPITISVFTVITPKNTPLTHHASTSANPNPMISPAFVEANYEILESLLRERRKQIRNEDLRAELEYFNEEYDEKRKM
ncbi:hypothetical protein Tco_1457991 [Tanacetum coccineum]